MTHLTTTATQRRLLTRDEVLDDLTARLATRRSQAFRQYQAYRRLAMRILNGSGSAEIVRLVERPRVDPAA